MQFTEEHSYSHTCTREPACGWQSCLIAAERESVGFILCDSEHPGWLWVIEDCSLVYLLISLIIGRHKMALNAPGYLQNVLLIRPWRPVHWEGGQSIIASSRWTEIKPLSYSRLGLSWNTKKRRRGGRGLQCFGLALKLSIFICSQSIEHQHRSLANKPVVGAA